MTIIPFNHLGQDYEIRCLYDGHTLHVRAFKDGKPANGFHYSVSSEVDFDLKTTQGQNAVAIFIENAKRDITEDRWNMLLSALGDR